MSANWLLDALSPHCQAFLADRLMTKQINSGEVLYEAGSPLQNLIFPLDGLVSLQLQISDGRLVENISLGRDGVLGGQYLIGETRLPTTAVTVIAGRASWLPIPDFLEAMERFPCVRPAIFACMARMMRRLMQGVACANVHSAAQRISTWLLHTDDRVQVDSFDLTQRTLANIFGLRAATVSEACNGLLNAGAIHYSRGHLSILDRSLLEAQACECYESVSLQTLVEAGPPLWQNVEKT